MVTFRMKDGTGKIDLKFTYEDTDRHGNVRLYVRRPGMKKGPPASKSRYTGIYRRIPRRACRAPQKRNRQKGGARACGQRHTALAVRAIFPLG